MEEINKKKFLVDCLRVLNKKLNNEEYQQIITLLEGFYQGETYGYDSGFDPVFYADLRNKNIHVKYANVIPLTRNK